MRRLALFVVALLAIGAPVLPAMAAPAQELAPTTPWIAQRMGDSCTVRRAFGQGGNALLVQLDRSQPGDEFNLLVAGQALGNRRNRSARFAFGPDGTTGEDSYSGLRIGRFGPAFKAYDITVLPEWISPAEAADSGFRFIQRVSDDKAASIQWLDIMPRAERPVRALLGPMDAPLASLRKCTDRLVRDWGLDPDRLRDMRRSPGPLTDPATWIQGSDYPIMPLVFGQETLLRVRLMVGIDGTVTSCHPQLSTSAPDFERAVCGALMKNAKLSPALDSAGHPMESYFIQSVRFQIDR